TLSCARAGEVRLGRPPPVGREREMEEAAWAVPPQVGLPAGATQRLPRVAVAELISGRIPDCLELAQRSARRAGEGRPGKQRGAEDDRSTPSLAAVAHMFDTGRRGVEAHGQGSPARRGIA